MKPVLSLLFLLNTVLLKAQFNNYLYPDIPTDNYEEIFLESPFVIQFPDIIMSFSPPAVIGYAVKWDSLQQTWTDTTMKLRHQAEWVDNAWKLSETLWQKDAGSGYVRASRTEIYNAQSWNFDVPRNPDSLRFFDWDNMANTWMIRKKIVYTRNDSDLVTQRLVFVSNFSKPDTVTYYSHDFDFRVIHLSKYNLNLTNNQYSPFDSITSGYYLDSLCRSSTRRVYEQDTLIKKSFFDYIYFNGIDSYKKRKLRWQSSGAWTASGEHHHITDFDTKEIFINFDTLLPQYYFSYKRSHAKYDDDWVPIEIKTDYRFSLQDDPDSSFLVTYTKDMQTGLVASVVHQKRLQYFSPYKNILKWVFLPADDATLPITEIINSHYFVIQNLQGGVKRIVTSDGVHPGQEKEVTIYNSGGQLILSQSFSGEEMSYFTATWPKGIYFAAVSRKGKLFCKSFAVF
jgi:hypothetical protein